MPFMNWVKTPDGYKPVEITDEEMVAQNTVKRAEREKMERIREQLEMGDMEREKMEFDKSRVYTALNADELKQGDKVIAGDVLASIKENVKQGKFIRPLYKVENECNSCRFVIKDDDYDLNGETINFALAYLVERAENCTNCGNLGNSYCSCFTRGKSDDELSRTVCGNYIRLGEQKAEPHYRPFKSAKELVDNVQANYTDVTLPYIWVKGKKATSEFTGWLVTGIGYDGVALGDTSLTWEELFDKYTFLDGSPCGVEVEE